MNTESLGRKVRMLALGLLLSVFVVPVLMWWQAGEAGAQCEPVAKVATSRFDLPVELAAPVSPAPSTQEPAPASVTKLPSGPATGLAKSVPQQAGTPAPAGAVRPSPSGGAQPAPARAAAPPDPFVPEPAPQGWQPPAPQPVPSELPMANAGSDGAKAPQSAIRHPQSATKMASSAPKTASVRAVGPAAPARKLPRPGAPKPVPAPQAQPLTAPAPALPPTPLGDVRLRGIIRGTPDLALMLVDGQTYFLKAGDTVTGTWAVGEIKDNSVVLRSGDHVRELQIEGGSQT